VGGDSFAQASGYLRTNSRPKSVPRAKEETAPIGELYYTSIDGIRPTRLNPDTYRIAGMVFFNSDSVAQVAADFWNRLAHVTRKPFTAIFKVFFDFILRDLGQAL